MAPPKQFTAEERKVHQKVYRAGYMLSDLRKRNVIRLKSLIADVIMLAKIQPCLDCGKLYPYCVMEFDHCRGIELFNIGVSHNQSRNIQSIKEEIKKCDVICANCHRIRTFNRGQQQGPSAQRKRIT